MMMNNWKIRRIKKNKKTNGLKAFNVFKLSAQPIK